VYRPNKTIIFVYCLGFQTFLYPLDAFIISTMYVHMRGTLWCGWLRHCTTSQKVACLILDVVHSDVIDNPPGCIMTLGSTQPHTEMSARNISWGVKATPVHRTDILTTFVSVVLKSGSLSLLETSWPVPSLYRDCLTFKYLITYSLHGVESFLRS
jgi:hypothetical protein